METVTQEDVTRTAVRDDGNEIEFKPEGASGPIIFRMSGSCGIVRNASVVIESKLSEHDRGSCVMTHDQARKLHSFLKRHLDKLTDVAPYDGQALADFEEDD